MLVKFVEFENKPNLRSLVTVEEGEPSQLDTTWEPLRANVGLLLQPPPEQIRVCNYFIRLLELAFVNLSL